MKNFSEPAEALNSTIREYGALCDPSFSQLGLFDGEASPPLKHHGVEPPAAVTWKPICTVCSQR